MRITVNHLRARVHLLNQILGRPEQHWTRKTEGGPLEGNPRHLFLEVHGNGTGRHWYTLNEVCSDGRGENQISRGYDGQQMDAYIEGFHSRATLSQA